MFVCEVAVLDVLYYAVFFEGERKVDLYPSISWMKKIIAFSARSSNFKLNKS